MTFLSIRGCEWTGAYSLDFRSIIRWYNSRKDRPQETEEARFSFIKGSYIEEEFDEEAGKIFIMGSVCYIR